MISDITNTWVPSMRRYIDEEALMKLIQRQGYLDFLRRNRERPIIKVVSGIRRCGKSTLFRLFKDKLLADNVKPEQIIPLILKNWNTSICEITMRCINIF